MKSVPLVLVLLLLAMPARGEVSVGRSGQLLVQAHEGGIWTPLPRGAKPRSILDPWGDIHGDGPPSVSVSPLTGMPEMVWAARRGNSRIQFAAFTGRSWEITSVTSNHDENLLPRLVHDAWGNRFVAWVGGEATGQVLASAAPAASPVFTRPLALSALGATAREPSLAVREDGALLIVWVEVSQDELRLVLAELIPPLDPHNILLGGGDLPTPIPRMSGGLLLDPRNIFLSGLGLPMPIPRMSGRIPLPGGHGTEPILHDAGGARRSPADYTLAGHPATGTRLRLAVEADLGLVWLTWIQHEPGSGANRPLSLAYAIYEGARFGEIRTVPLRSPGDKDLERARDRVRRIVLGTAN